MTHALHEAQPVAWLPDDTSFGARLVLVRQRMRWGNVAKAATECGIPADSWRNWEEGREPHNRTAVAKAIAERTGCDFRWLVMGPSRAHLEQRMHVTACYDPWPDLTAMPAPAPVTHYDVESGPVDRLPLTRAVEQTRPVRRPVQPVSLLVRA